MDLGVKMAHRKADLEVVLDPGILDPRSKKQIWLTKTFESESRHFVANQVIVLQI